MRRCERGRHVHTLDILEIQLLGPHSAVARVTCRKILTSVRTQTHPWPQLTADSFRNSRKTVIDDILRLSLSYKTRDFGV